MKRNIFWLFAALLSTATFTTTMTSCENDPCKDVVCDDNSDCFDGECICRVGYEKDANGNCVLERAKFVGTYTVSDDCSSSGSSTYIVTAIAGSSDELVSISNFWEEFSSPVIASVSGSNITIDRQEPIGNGFFVEGNGTYSNGTINFNYKITDETDPNNIDTDDCNSVWVKN